MKKLSCVLAALFAIVWLNVAHTPASYTVPVTTSASVLDRSTTEQNVVSTAALTSVYSYAVPGGTLSTNRTIRCTMTGANTNTSGGTSTLVVNVTFGGVNLTATAAITTIGNNTTNGPMHLIVWLNANGATNSQRAMTELRRYGDTTNNTDGTYSPNVLNYSAIHSALTLDSTASQTLVINVQHQTSASTISFKRWAVVTELLGS